MSLTKRHAEKMGWFDDQGYHGYENIVEDAIGDIGDYIEYQSRNISELNKTLEHDYIQKLGFEGGFPLGYKKGRIVISIYEDEDTLDKFMVHVEDIKVGWAKTRYDLHEIIEQFDEDENFE